MLKLKLIAFLLSLNGAFCHCHEEKKQLGFESNKGTYQLKKIGRLPKALTENSGLQLSHDADLLWTHQDSGGAAALFQIDLNGIVIDTLAMPGLVNRDWEAITGDNQGYLYIGDFGNNLNQRRDLKIYRVGLKEGTVDVLAFEYEQQTEYPPPRARMNFDAEAFFWRKGQLHIFSKNRGVKWVQHYEIPDQPGSFVLKAKDNIKLKGRITDAAISPDGRLMALLSYKKIWLFELEEEGNLWEKPLKCLKINRGQTEGLAFINETDLVISNETGRLFLLSKRSKTD